MAVKIYLSNTFEQAANNVYRELRQLSQNGRNVVIVPDKFSLSAENSILEKLEIKGSFNVEVMSFTRYAANSLKDKINRCLTPEGSVMLLTEAINRVRSQLSVYKTASIRAGFPREIYAVITSLRNSGIVANDIMNFSGDDSTAKKLYDIGLIYQSYLQLIESDLSDSSTRLQAFADYIPNIDNIAQTNVFILDFYEFTAPQYDIIERLIGAAANVIIGLVEPTADCKNARLYPQRAYNKIIGSCKSIGVQPEIVHNYESLPEYKKQLLNNLYSYEDVDKVDLLQGEIEVLVAPSMAVEVERTAKLIRYLIVEKGLRYRDIAVVVSDTEGYSREIRNIFSRFEIPCFIDKKVQFSDQPAAKYMLAALRAAASGLSYQSVQELIKNPFFYGDAAGYETVEQFENYVLKYSCKKRLNTPFIGEDANTLSAEKVRKRIIGILKPFDGLKTEAAEIFALALERFAADNKIIERCEAFAESGEGEEAKASAQIYDKFLAILEELKVTVAKTELTISAFADLIEGVFQNVKIALVPLYLDSVFVGGVDEARYDNARIMCILGALDKKLPASVADTAVIGLNEEAALIVGGIDVFPTKKETVKNGLFNLIQLLIKHKDKLIISYPESFSGTEAKASTLIAQLASLFTVDGKPLTARRITDESLSDTGLSLEKRAKLYAYKFSSRRNGYYQLLSNVSNEAVRPADMQPYDSMFYMLSQADRDRLNKYMVAVSNEKTNIRGNLMLSRGTFSASQLETYFACPYKQYFAYGLRLSLRDEGELHTFDTGSIIHKVLEDFVKTKSYLITDTATTESFVKGVIEAERNSDEYKYFNEKKHVNVFNRLCSECVKICASVAAQIAQSAFKPFITEAEIGFKENGADFEGIKVKLDGGEYTLRGYIDRIDECDGLFTVIDYKSYKKSLNFSSVFNGENIQPVLYMTAVSGEDKLKYPVGLLYQPVLVGYKSKAYDRNKMKGLIINDVSVLEQLDEKLRGESKSEYLPVLLTTKREVNKNSRSAIDSEVFTALEVYTKKLIAEALCEIEEGFINPMPIKGSCDKCDYASICAYCDNGDYTRKKFAKVSDKDMIKLANGEKIEAEFEEETEEGQND